MSKLEMHGVGKSYGRGPHALNVLENVNLSVRDGELVAIVGFSGSGKTTLLSLLAGLEVPDSGRALMDGRPIHGPSLDRGLVFQNYSLLPWLSVWDNVALAVDAAMPRLSRRQRSDRVASYVAMVGLSEAAQRRPSALSGGMRQRVAVARALAADPDVLLLDEPLGALDALTRGSLQAEIARIWESDRKTVVLVTNDVDEAILLADRIVPLKPGPPATLGPDFRVALARPRVRSQLNHDPVFRRIRNDVIEYLIAARCAPEARHNQQREPLPLPNVRPIHAGAV